MYVAVARIHNRKYIAYTSTFDNEYSAHKHAQILQAVHGSFTVAMSLAEAAGIGARWADTEARVA